MVIDKDASLGQILCSYSNVINIRKKQDSEEKPYGRAEYLYFLQLARTAFDAQDGSNRSLIDDTPEKSS
jgi:hypothetical protein